MTDCFLGIDIGTGSSKGVITDPTGKILADAIVSHSMEMPQPGFYEQDAEEIWWGDFTLLSRILTERIHSEHGFSAHCIKAVGVSTIAPCVLPVDKAGTPLRPGIMYGIDTRGTEEIAEMEKLIGKEEIFRMSGQELSSQACGPKIRWIEKNEPEVWDKTHKILTASGYVVYRLTGRYTLDIYNAIAYAPVFNLGEKRWDTSLNDPPVIDMDKMPELLWSTEIAGTVTSSASELTGLVPGTPVITGTADAASEAIGVGICSPGDMMMMYGSSNFFILRTEKLVRLKSFWTSNFLDPGSSVLTGGMATAGSLFKWFRETFPGRSLAEWEQLASLVVPDADGPTILPYFAGERTPLNNPSAKGVIFGLSLQTGAGELYRALQEAVAFGIKHNIDEMKAQGIEARRIVAIGGATESRRLMQIISDVTGLVQQLPDKTPGACYGDAFLAAVGTGYFNDSTEAEQWVNIADEIIPRSDHDLQYEKKYSRYRELYESTQHLL